MDCTDGCSSSGIPGATSCSAIPPANVSTATIIFIITAIFELGSCFSAFINVLIEGFQTIGNQQGVEDKNDSIAPLSFLILIFYVLLHISGYNANYINSPVSKCQLTFTVCGFLVVLSSAVIAMAVHQKGSEKQRGYTAIACTVLQCIAMVIFIICAVKQQCFGTCRKSTRIGFYVVGAIYLIWTVGYLFTLKEFYTAVMSEPKLQSVSWEKFRCIAPINYLIQIALTVSIYQINMCCLPFTYGDMVFVVVSGALAGTFVSLLTVILGLTTFEKISKYPRTAILYVLTISLLIYIHWGHPFSAQLKEEAVGVAVLGSLLLVVFVVPPTMLGYQMYKQDKSKDGKNQQNVSKWDDVDVMIPLGIYVFLVTIGFVWYLHQCGITEVVVFKLRGPNSVGGVYK
ncbi:putative integral membrane protein [Babesia bovis T2Bo]|uniref:Uncharacterized protein n=1 Tax=Babesia bovis TaxID=5865 RepID=A7AV11_BABBO|nr:putative integral membrane protein [Babesia bovis T2Bo]EDO05637.1 putative integral membrane protein [Babesia bovis T2Bo]|eukprot:XP_001609205.1 hypothetical protein [Babesia bovis T2Bo]